MKLYFLENESSVQQILASPSYETGTDAVICVNYLALVRMRQAPGSHLYVFGEDLLSAGDYAALHAKADEIAFGWYRFDGRDPTLHDGVSFGELVKIIFDRKYFSGVMLKYGEILRLGAEKWPGISHVLHDLAGPGISTYFWHDEDGTGFNKARALETIAAQLGLKSTYLPAPAPLRAASGGSRQQAGRPAFGIRRAIRGCQQLGVDCMTVALNAVSQVRRAINRTGPRIYIFPYSNNQTSLFRRLNDGFILSFLPIRRLSLLLFSGVSFLDFGKRARRSADSAAAAAELRTLLEKHRGQGAYRAIFTFRKLDYTDIYLPVIEQLLARYLPELTDYYRSVRRSMSRENIGSIILNDTVDEKNQVVVAAARAAGVRSVFVDHGFVALKSAIRAGTASGGEITVTPGTYDPLGGKGQTAVLGNPCLDQYVRIRARDITGIKRVLFLSYEDNFYARYDRFAWQERYYEEIFSVFAHLNGQGVEVWYKPHPGEVLDYHHYLFRFFGVADAGMRVVQSLPFAEVVQQVDLVVSNVSSCFFESQAAGVPTIFMEPHFVPGSVCMPLDGTPWEDVIRVQSGAELLRIIEENRSNPARLLDFVRRFSQQSGDVYLGTLDGMASDRILDYVSALNRDPGRIPVQGRA